MPRPSQSPALTGRRQIDCRISFGSTEAASMPAAARTVSALADASDRFGRPVFRLLAIRSFPFLEFQPPRARGAQMSPLRSVPPMLSRIYPALPWVVFAIMFAAEGVVPQFEFLHFF